MYMGSVELINRKIASIEGHFGPSTVTWQQNRQVEFLGGKDRVRLGDLRGMEEICCLCDIFGGFSSNLGDVSGILRRLRLLFFLGCFCEKTWA